MFDKLICIYSNYCNFSQEFINILANVPVLLSEFKFICIDIDKTTKKRSEEFFQIKKILKEQFNYTLKCVPTIIVENGEFILCDKDAFEWLNYKINTINNKMSSENEIQQQQQDVHQEVEDAEVSGFNPNEMGALSDIYSTFGFDDTDPCTDAKEQCFAFLGKKICIDTPDGELPTNLPKQVPQQPQQQQSKSVRFSNSGNMSNMSNLSRNMSNISFTSNKSNMNKGNMNNKMYGSEKEKEITNKYEELMQERSLMDEKLKQDRKMF